MLEELDEYNWGEAFGYAGEPDREGYGTPEPVIDFKGECGPFSREDVEDILAMDAGEHDGPNWVIAGKLKNGYYFYLEAGCDYTGWD